MAGSRKQLKDWGWGMASLITQDADAPLVRRTLEGDFTAYQELFEKYQGKVFSIAYCVAGNREDAEDISQEVFLKLPDRLRRYDPDYSLAAWLGAVAANEAKYHLRKQKNKPRASSEEIDFARVPGESIAFSPDGSGGDPGAGLLEEEVRRALAEGITRLPARLRNPLLLHDVSALRYDQIAASLGLKMGTVKSRISRARVSLGRILIDEANPYRELFQEMS
jgi:RNA polymerase sigma-70 factor (ECF subfamily)